MNILQTLSPLAQAASGRPLFTAEGPQVYGAALRHNQQFAQPSSIVQALAGAKGPYQTALNPGQERSFDHWVSSNRIPFDPNAAKTDYDMRGFWLQQQQAPQSQGRASNGHFPDTFKTPYDSTFSNESKYATKDNPFVWVGNTLVDGRTGQVVFK